MRKIVYACLCAAVAAMFLTSCGGTPRGGEDPQSSAAASVTRSDQEDGEETKKFEESPEFDSTRMLSADSREFCGIYLKAGDPSYRIEVKPGGRRNRNQLSFTVSRSFKDHFGSETLHFCQMFPDFSRKEWMSFDLTDQASEGNRLSCGFQATWNEEELWIEFQGRSDGIEDGAVGRYYPEDCYVMPEAFFRPLNRADLWGLAEEDMRILRNQFYAAHGRAFADKGLQTYFENQPWYRPNAASSSGTGGEEPADFDETVFSGVEKRNIEFLLEMEKMLSERENPQTASDELLKGLKDEYEMRSQTPYYQKIKDSMAGNSLPRSEILVEISADPEDFEDHGVFYTAPGRISLPVTVSPADYEAVMKNRQEAEITVNGLTGETAVMRISDNIDFGECRLYYEGEDEPDYYFITYEPYSGNYHLWQNSADTLFQPVYEGDIFILKGAQEEYVNYFPIPLSSHPEGPYALRNISPEGEFSGDYYGGNYPVFDSRGYLKALYYAGD